ncbi:MAG: carbonic anhydrase [Thiohalomonadales bacterium]
MNISRSISVVALLFFCYSTAVFSAAGTTWSYSGTTGPEVWSNLSAEYELCGTGQKQSPIDLTMTIPEALPWLQYNYRRVDLEIENNTHTVEVIYHSQGELVIDDRQYRLLQFHFHAPSEHTENGLAAQMEIHFVHIDSTSQLAVVAVMVDEGFKNTFFENIISRAPTNKGTVTYVGQAINAGELLPENPSHYRAYSGSLTTPPCSEAVRWFVLEEHIEFARDQIENFLAIIGENARPEQSLNDRMITIND